MTLEEALKRIEELEAENRSLKAKYEKPLTWNLPSYYITNGTRKNAIEVYFDAMPGTGYINELKNTLKMRWNSKKKCWYGFVTRNDVSYILQDGKTEDIKPDDLKTDDDGFIIPDEDPFGMPA